MSMIFVPSPSYHMHIDFGVDFDLNSCFVPLIKYALHSFLATDPDVLPTVCGPMLQWLIEMAFFNGSQLAGITADIQKAFNFLPREVIMQACLLLGLSWPYPNSLVWCFSKSTKKVPDSSKLGPPLSGVCLAVQKDAQCPCLGMLVIDILFHTWVRCQFPLSRPMSYVDDWQVLTTDPSHLTGNFVISQRFHKCS